MSKTNETTTYYQPFDDAITLYLKRNRMTQAYFASEIGIAKNSLSWKRRGIRDWKLSEVVKACDIVGITLDAAVGRTVSAA